MRAPAMIPRVRRRAPRPACSRVSRGTPGGTTPDAFAACENRKDRDLPWRNWFNNMLAARNNEVGPPLHAKSQFPGDA